MNSADKTFLALGGLLLCACAPDLLDASDPIGAVAGAVVSVGSGALCLSFLFLVIRSVLLKLNIFGYRDQVRYLEAIDAAERFFGRQMSAEERGRFDRAYWS